MTALPFTPRPFQHLAIAHLTAQPRCALWMGMGMGKTASVLEALCRLALVQDTFPVLVVAPLRVAQSTWPDEVAKWSSFSHLKIKPIIGDTFLRSMAVDSKADIYTINYENIPWLISYLEQRGRGWPFKIVVSDESTRLKGFRSRQGTQRARALADALTDEKGTSFMKGCGFIELTGTPSPNGLADLWGQAWFLDMGVRLGRTYTAFTQRWFQRSFDGYGVNPLPHAQKEIQEKLKDICLSLEAKDYFDLKEPIVRTIYVDLPPLARKLYNDMEKQMYAEIEGIGVEAFNAAGKTNKCLQLANGAAYVDENAESWKEVHDAKIKALESVIEEAAGMPVLVAYHFRSDLDRLRRAFPKGRVLDKNPQTIRDWNAGKIPVLFAHPASAGHGLNLQDGGNILVHFAHDWNLENYLQILERIGPTRQMQAGHDRPVFVYHIVARNTVEEVVMERVETKRSVQDLLMEAMKRRKQND